MIALVDSVAIVKKIRLHMDSALGKVRNMVASMLKCVLQKNACFDTLCRISEVLWKMFDTSDIK